MSFWKKSSPPLRGETAPGLTAHISVWFWSWGWLLLTLIVGGGGALVFFSKDIKAWAEKQQNTARAPAAAGATAEARAAAGCFRRR